MKLLIDTELEKWEDLKGRSPEILEFFLKHGQHFFKYLIEKGFLLDIYVNLVNDKEEVFSESNISRLFYESTVRKYLTTKLVQLAQQKPSTSVIKQLIKDIKISVLGGLLTGNLYRSKIGLRKLREDVETESFCGNKIDFVIQNKIRSIHCLAIDELSDVLNFFECKGDRFFEFLIENSVLLQIQKDVDDWKGVTKEIIESGCGDQPSSIEYSLIHDLSIAARRSQGKLPPVEASLNQIKIFVLGKLIEDDASVCFEKLSLMA